MCCNPQTIFIDKEEYKIPCGKCILCRTKRARNWAIKLIKEAEYHKKICMITLTFDNEKLIHEVEGSNFKWSKNLEYSKEYFKKFMKKLRKHFEAGQISYFKVGEYGELRKRAHYHVILFGVDLNDLKCIKIGTSKKQKDIYFSPIIEKCWKLGRTSVSECPNPMIKYVANYNLKKLKTGYGNSWRKNIISFSNRNKIGIKWARRHHKAMRKGYITDNEQQKYGIPRSWKNELERLTNFGISKREMLDTGERIEQKAFEYIEEMKKTGKLSIEYLKKKAEILEYRLKHEKNQRLDL